MANKWLCGTPSHECTGGGAVLAPGIAAHVSKVHNSPSEAFRCYVRWLKSQGYEAVGQREFRPPDGGPILVLTKKCRFGGRLRSGKMGRYMQTTYSGCEIIAR
jgi:hypothetical protein